MGGSNPDAWAWGPSELLNDSAIYRNGEVKKEK